MNIPLFIIDALLLVLVLFIVVLTVTIFLHLFVHVPYVPTPAVVVQQMVRLAALQPGETVVDLGAGDARLLIRAKQVQPAVRAIGYELILLIWALGWLNIRWHRVQINWFKKNLLKADLRQADVVFLYLIPSMMQKLRTKFTAELKPGTRIISHSFQLPDRTPIHQEKIKSYMGETTLRQYVW